MPAKLKTTITRALREPGLVFAVLGAIAVLAYGENYSSLYYRSVVDDALISMQYAKNLAQGNGLVFNIGERVEGYTNFLWVMFMTPLYALCGALHVEFVPWVAHMSIVIAASNILLVYAIGRQLWSNNWVASLVALGLCVVDNSYVVWAALGLEGHFLGFWLLLAFWLTGSRLRRRGLWTGLTLAAAQMTRPDAVLFNAFLVAGLGATWLSGRRQGLPEHRETECMRTASTAFATWIAVYGVYFAWRYSYYGWAFPNTYYLKVGAGEFNGWQRGLEYVEGFLKERWWVPAVALCGVLAPTTPIARAVVLYLAAHTLYVVYIGGDFFAGHRFFVAQIPLFGIAAGLAVHALCTRLVASDESGDPGMRKGEQPGGVVLALCAMVLLSGLYRSGQRLGPLQGEILANRGFARMHRNFMRWLSLHKPANASIATCCIGSAGFDAEFTRVIDMLGVIDPAVAHRSVENFGSGRPGHEKSATMEEVLQRKPTYIHDDSMRTDLWERGYYFDASMRWDLAKTVQGIWHRDELAEFGRYLKETALDFDVARSTGWTASGSAFEHWPTAARPESQSKGLGERGFHVNTFSQTIGNASTGRLLSPPFQLVGEKIVLRVGGDFDPTRLLAALSIDGRRLLSETGFDSEHLSRREWRIAAYRGKQARLEVLDDSSEGHIMVDEVVQWQP